MSIEAALALARDLRTAGRLAEAETVGRHILAEQPDHPEALHLLGTIAFHVGKNALAIELIGRAIQRDGAVAHFHCNLGLAFEAAGRLDEAASANRAALALDPQLADAHFNLGNVALRQRRIDAAEAAFRAALCLRPESAEAHHNLANILKEQGRLDEAIAARRAALRLRPDDPVIRSNLIYDLEFHPGADSRTIREEQEQWSRRHEPPMPDSAVDRDPDRRLRIGYVSPDFRDHTVGRNLVPLFAHHDRTQFEILCYSGVREPDAITERIRRHADRWRDTSEMPDERLARAIRDDGVDILVDLSLHLAGNRLPVFALRPAPVQVSFAAYPGSTGLRAIPLHISDPHLDSSAPCHIESFWCFDPLGDDVTPNPLPALDCGHVTFGCLNSFFKVNEPTLARWARVLGRVKNSRLLLLCVTGRHRESVLACLNGHGVSPDLIEFAEPRPRRGYLELHHRVDIALDTFPYHGHTTSLEGLWMGVPVVSLVGERPVSRAGLSLLTNLGLPELAAHSEEAFIDTAAQLAHDLPRLAELRSTLRARVEASPLMDAPRFARGIEAAYREMWRAHTLSPPDACARKT